MLRRQMRLSCPTDQIWGYPYPPFGIPRGLVGWEKRGQARPCDREGRLFCADRTASAAQTTIENRTALELFVFTLLLTLR